MGWLDKAKKIYWDTSAYIRHATSSKPKTRQQELDDYYKEHNTYKGFKLNKGETIGPDGYIHNGAVHQGAVSKPAGSGPSIMTDEGQKKYSGKSYNPVKARQNKGLFSPSDGLC